MWQIFLRAGAALPSWGGGGDREAFILLGQSYARSPSEVAFSLGQARQPFSSMKDDNMFIADKVYAYRQLEFYEKLISLDGVLEAFIFLTGFHIFDKYI